MKVDKYDVLGQSGVSLWVIVEHGTDINSVKLLDGYSIKGFSETFDFTSSSDHTLKHEVAMSCMKEKGYYFGTNNAGCQL